MKLILSNNLNLALQNHTSIIYCFLNHILVYVMVYEYAFDYLNLIHMICHTNSKCYEDFNKNILKHFHYTGFF